MNHLDPISFARHQRQSAGSYDDYLWQLLRNRQLLDVKFRRQQPLGPYTADFWCAEARLVVEIDGAPHFTAEGMSHDAVRDAWMVSQGIRVLRFTGAEVENEAQRVLEQIRSVLRAIEADRHPSPPTSAPADSQPLPQGERGECNGVW